MRNFKTLILYPECRSLDASRIYEDLDFQAERGGGRDRDKEKNGLPYVVMNAVSTLDGKISRDGKSSGIGSDVDRMVMRTIRSRADAVLVGAGTIRAEKLSLTVTEELEEWRTLRGESPQPLGVILSREGKRINSTALEEAGPNILTLTEDQLPRAPTQSATGQGEEDRLEDYLRLLRGEYGVKTLLVEGGPTVNHGFLKNRLVDELFLTLSPKVYGGQEPNLIAGVPFKEPLEGLGLLSLYCHEDEIFLRYYIS